MNPKSAQPVYGIHTVSTILEHEPQRILELFVDSKRHDSRIDTVLELAQTIGISIHKVSSETLNARAGDSRHQGVVAMTRARASLNEQALMALLEDLSEEPFLLILDGIQDPHNLGACLRSADAAGVHAVVAPRDRACGLTPAVRKVASGAAETIAFAQVTNLARTLRELKHRNIQIIGLSAEAQSNFYAQSLNGPVAIVLGAEGKGLRRLTREACDVLAALPMRGQVASLNVSATAAVCLYEALRQRATDAG